MKKYLLILSLMIICSILASCADNSSITETETPTVSPTVRITQSPIPTMEYDPKLGASWKQALLEIDTFMRQIREPDMTKPIVISEGNVWYQLKNVSTMDALKKQLEPYVYNNGNEQLYNLAADLLLSMYEIMEKDGIPMYNPDNNEGRYYVDFDAEFPYNSDNRTPLPFKYVGSNSNYSRTDMAIIDMYLQNGRLKFYYCYQWLDQYTYGRKPPNNYNIKPLTITKEQIAKGETDLCYK